MLRRQMMKSFQTVLTALKEANIRMVIRGQNAARPDQGSKDAADGDNMIESHRKWSQASDRFDDTARLLIRTLGLDFLFSDQFWRNAIAKSEPVLNRREYFAFQFFTEKVETFVNLLRQEFDVHADREEQGGQPDNDVFIVLLVEDSGHSSPARISMLMESVQSLYDVCAELEGEARADLSVVSCDSGSDKSFDFLGVAKVMEQVRKIVLDLWDRVIFYREKKLDARLQLLAKSLPVIERISELEDRLGPEQAEKLRRDVLGGVKKFFEAGAVIPEMEKASSFSPRQLMAPEPKLLVCYPEDGSGSEGKGGIEREPKETPSNDEDRELQRRVDKAVQDALNQRQSKTESKLAPDEPFELEPRPTDQPDRD